MNLIKVRMIIIKRYITVVREILRGFRKLQLCNCLFNREYIFHRAAIVTGVRVLLCMMQHRVGYAAQLWQ